MTTGKANRPRGSIILKLIIAALLVIMMTSLLYPNQEWKRQDRQREKSQLRMENLSYAIREYGHKHQGYIDDLDEYLRFIKEDSVLFDAPRYELESLVRDTGEGRDSLLVDFTDEFHLSHFIHKEIRPDSIHLFAVPHSQFKKIPVTTLILSSENPIAVVNREKNVTDHAVLVYAASKINYEWYYPEPIMLKSTEALISIPADSLGICPTTYQPYLLNVNTRSHLEGKVKFLVHKEPADTNITRDTLMVDLLNHRIKTEALAEVLLAVQQDSSLVDQKDSLLIMHFHQKISEIKPKKEWEITGDHVITVPADSMQNWDDSLRIKKSVLVTHIDSLSLALKNFDDFVELTQRVSYMESYYIAKIDTIGVTIRSPIGPDYIKPNQTFFDKIFGISAPENHGYVENGDISWSEKK